MRINANKLADILANQGVNNEDCRMVKNWKEMPQNRAKVLCNEQVAEEMEVVRYHGGVSCRSEVSPTNDSSTS